MKFFFSHRIKNLFPYLQSQIWLQFAWLLGVWKLLVLGSTWIGHLLPAQKLYSSYFEPYIDSLSYFWRSMSNFDGQHYLAIASMGYLPATQAFFPLYPLIIHIMWKILHVPFIICGLIVSHFSFWMALYIVYRLFNLDQVKTKKGTVSSSIWLCLIIIITFPTAQFYGAVYNDALFFLLATLTLWLGRSRKFILASIVGGLATLTRLNGLALLPFLFFEFLTLQIPEGQFWQWRWWQRNWWRLPKKILNPKVLIMFLIPLSFGAYLLLHQFISHSWQVVFGNMQIWHQDKITFPPQVVWRYLKILAGTSFQTYQYWVAFLELSFVIFYLACLAYGWRRIRFSYWIFVALSILIPWLTGSFQGMPRYGLHLYPLFLILTLWLESMPKRVKIIYFTISLLLFVFYTALFTRGYFVA